jgi:fumarylacetoacetase
MTGGEVLGSNQLDETHDPSRRSWIASANVSGADFPIQNLPLGVFRQGGRLGEPRIGVAVGDFILDLRGIAARIEEEIEGASQFLAAPSLIPLMNQEPRVWSAVRKLIFRFLEAGSPSRHVCEPHLVPMRAAEMLMPVRPGGFIDFFASIQHATNAGRLFRPASPLLPNYKYVPIGYNGRTSTIRCSGAEIFRPNGQRKPAGQDQPDFGPSSQLDFEMELGIFLSGHTQIGQPVPIAGAWSHIFGFCLLNDWSARDIQAWEYQPLGPFLGKTFATSISPWIITADALRPFRVPAFARAAGDPTPLPYLFNAADQDAGSVDVKIEVWFRSESMSADSRPSRRIGAASTRELYWTPAQLIAHQTSNGCNIEAGDLYGSGTVSGETEHSLGSFLEITFAGKKPVAICDGVTRTFLEDGDEVTLKGRCRRSGFVSIGFGNCSGVIVPGPSM